MTPDWNHIGRSDAQRLVDAHADWACDYHLERDVFRLQHLPSGRSVEISMFELSRERDKTQVSLKNAIIALATKRLMRPE